MSNLPSIVKAQTNETTQYITFHVGEELFGVDIMCVEEIIIPRKPTLIPTTPDYFLGILNLRGLVISILDLRLRFGMQAIEQTDTSRIVVIHTMGHKLGLLVDGINSIVTVGNENVKDTSMILATDKQQYITGSYKLDAENILLLLDQDKIINEDDFYIHRELQTSSQELVQQAEQIEEEISKEIFLVGFCLGQERYAIESLYVEEIIQLPEITPVPEMERFVEGIFHLRETVIPAIKLREKMGMEPLEVSEENPVIIIKIFDIKIGLIVDQITKVHLIKEEEIAPPPVTLNPKQLDQLKGVIKLEEESKRILVMMIKPEELFSLEEQDLLTKIDQQNEQNKNEEERITEEEVPILEFMLAKERYAILVSEANEIIPLRQIVPVPKAPPHIMGVINLRGDVISIVNLPILVGHEGYVMDEQTKILVVNPGAETAGLVVEKVIGIRKTLLSSFDPPSDLLMQRGNIFIKGIGKDKTNDEIVILMDMGKTLFQAHGGTGEHDDITMLQQELEALDQQDQGQLEQQAPQALLESDSNLAPASEKKLSEDADKLAAAETTDESAMDEQEPEIESETDLPTS